MLTLAGSNRRLRTLWRTSCRQGEAGRSSWRFRRLSPCPRQSGRCVCVRALRIWLINWWLITHLQFVKQCLCKTPFDWVYSSSDCRFYFEAKRWFNLGQNWLGHVLGNLPVSTVLVLQKTVEDLKSEAAHQIRFSLKPHMRYVMLAVILPTDITRTLRTFCEQSIISLL